MKPLICLKCFKKQIATKTNLSDHYLSHTRNCLILLAKNEGIQNPYFISKEDLAKELAERSEVVL